MEALFKLFQENTKDADWAINQLRGIDRRGHFEANDLTSFREEAEAREDPLQTVGVDAMSPEEGGSEV